MHRVPVSGACASSLNVGGFLMMLLLPAVENRDSTPTRLLRKSSVGQGDSAQGLHGEFTVSSWTEMPSTLTPPTSVILPPLTLP